MRRSNAMPSRSSFKSSSVWFNNARSCSWIKLGSRWKNWRTFLLMRWRSSKQSSRSSSFSSIVASVIVAWSKHTFNPNCWSNGRAIRKSVSRNFLRDNLFLTDDGAWGKALLGRILFIESNRWSIDCNCPWMSCISWEFKWLFEDACNWSLQRQINWHGEREIRLSGDVTFEKWRSPFGGSSRRCGMEGRRHRCTNSRKAGEILALFRMNYLLLVPISRALIILKLLP